MIAETSANYVRLLAETPSPLPDAEQIGEAYHWLKKYLLETTFPEGYRVEANKLEDNELIHFAHTGSIVAAAGNTFRIVHQSLTLGLDLYETPPPESELEPTQKIPFIHENNPMKNPVMRDRIIENAMGYFGAKPAARPFIEEYFDTKCPMDLLWLISTVSSTVQNYNEMVGGTFLDEDGKIIKDANGNARVMLLNAVSGAGGMMAHHDRIQNGADPFTLFAAIESNPTGFISRMFGIQLTKTIGGACAASGNAINVAEQLAASSKSEADVFIVMSAYPGPIKETREAFEAAEIHMSDRPPYLNNKSSGYTEAPAAVTSIFVKKSVAERQGLDLNKGRLIQSVTWEGKNVVGVDEVIPLETYRHGFEKLKKYYSPDYTGTIVFATHGVNTMGWFTELEAIRELKKIYYPNAHFIITSTQPQMGHPYAPRACISVEAVTQSIEEGVLFGMVRANEDMSIVNQSFPQVVRRESIRRLGLKIIKREWSFDGSESENKASERRLKKRISELQEEQIEICFGSVKIPEDVPFVATHTGLHAESVLVYSLPLIA